MAYSSNPSIQEAETGKKSHVQGQPRIHSTTLKHIFLKRVEYLNTDWLFYYCFIFKHDIVMATIFKYILWRFMIKMQTDELTIKIGNEVLFSL